MLFSRLRRFHARTAAHDVSAGAAQLAFFTLLAIIPALLSLLGLLPLVRLESQTKMLQELVRRGLPPSAADTVLLEVERIGQQSGWPLLFSAVLAVYYAGQALSAMLRGTARAFEVESKPGRLNLVGWAVTGLVLVVSPILLLALTLVTSALSLTRSLNLFPELYVDLVDLARVPVLLLFFQLFVRFVYALGSHRATFPLFSPGSLSASLGWLLATQGFEAYLTRFSSVGATYGSLATAVGFLLYTHLVGSLVLYGAELDAYVYVELARPDAPKPA